MMYLMILVEIWQVEQFVAPESKKIFNVVNYEYYLKKDLAEIWEIVKAKFCSLYHRNVECYRKYNQLIKDQLFYYSSQLILPIFPLPWPWCLLIDQKLVIINTPAKVSRRIDEKTQHHEEEMQAVWPDKDELRFVFHLFGPIHFSNLYRGPHNAKQQWSGDYTIRHSLFSITCLLYLHQPFQFLNHQFNYAKRLLNKIINGKKDR